MIPQPFIHLAVEEGLTVAQFYKFNFLKVKNDRGVKHFWAPYIGSKMCDLMLGLKRKSKILNIAYFFIPLLIFLVLSFGVSRKYFILFFYYFISSILLISQSFLESPFYVFHLLNINLSEGASRILGFLIFVCYLTFAYFIYLGYKNIKKEGMKFEEKLILAFFFLLPIFLRF